MPIFVHFSAHENSDGLRFGRDFVNWSTLASEISEMFRGIYSQESIYEGPIDLVVSSCRSKEQTMTRSFSKLHEQIKMENPPEYIFVFDNEEVIWNDAIVIWSLFYRMVPKLDFLTDGGRKEIQEFIKVVSKLGGAKVFSLEF